jgi:hypothetical protein
MVSEKPSTIAVGNGVILPKGYQVAKDLNLVNLRPWHFVSDSEFDGLFEVVNKHYSVRTVIPFARRSDSDDVACFVSRDPEQEAGQIIIIHDFASPGYEVVARMKNFWDWFRQVVNDMIEWHEASA